MGAINLKHTGSGSDVTLSSDGTDLLLNGTAIGGGGGSALELYAENYDGTTTLPSATGNNAVALGTLSTSSGAISFSFGNSSTASGSNSVALGRNAKAINSYSFATGNSYSSGTDSVAMGITNNTASYGATGANSVAIGYLSKSNGTGSTAIGREVQASATGAMALGYQSQATSFYAVATGRNAKSDIRGKHAYGTDQIYGAGLIQAGLFILCKEVSNATPAVLTTNLGTPNTINQIILPNNSAYAFHGTIVARQQASQGTACAAWRIEGLIRREGSAGTTVLVNSATTVIDNTPAWGLALSADTTNGGLKIEVTGAAATNIRWVATVHTSEVTY